MAANTPWDPNGFKSIVGRDPTQAETDFYSKVPTWQTDVQNAAGGGQATQAGQYGQGYQTPQGQTNYGDPPQTSQPQVQPGGVQQPQAQQPQAAQGQTPSYYNASDPVQQAVWNSFQAKGIQPRDQADFQYWVDKINQSGGLANGYQNSGGTGSWQDRMNSANGGVGDYRTGGAPIQGGTMGGGGFGGDPRTMFGPGGNGTFGSPEASALYAKLMGRADQSLSFDPRTDAIARPQIDAFDATRQQQDRNTLSQLAESGGPNANLSAATRAAGEASGQATSGFAAQLGQNELNARRTEIQNALSGAQGLLTSQQQMALQEELSNLDRAQQESQFGRTLANNAYQFDINDQYRNSPLSWA